MFNITSREEIAANLRALKGRRRVSDSELAAVIGAAVGRQISTTSMNERLRGVVRCPVDELQAIAAYFDVPLEALLQPSAGGAA